jgi:hypothetical protein
MKVEIVPATEEHCRILAETMRKEDLAEVSIGVFSSPIEDLLWGLENDDFTETVLVDGKVAFIFGGAVDLDGQHGEIWGLSSDVCERVPILMVKLGRRIVGEYLEICPEWSNFCDARYARSLKWLKLIGAELGERVSFPKGDKIKFTIRRK